ncbi:RNA polymerase C sigma-24 subunit C ECF subfamily protein [Streptomyces sp. 769]|nr:RNA polymerase C sigma-24 subunit C ECF subfamily protein [Streptomyces sp. 769]
MNEASTVGNDATGRATGAFIEVFDVGYDEIAAAVDKSPAAVRQIAHRARQHVDARRPRQAVSADKSQAAVQAFRRALETGELQGLLDVLAPEVVLVSDSGGRPGRGRSDRRYLLRPQPREADPHRVPNPARGAPIAENGDVRARAGLVRAACPRRVVATVTAVVGMLAYPEPPR